MSLFCRICFPNNKSVYIYDSKGFTFNSGNSSTYEKRFKTEGNVPLTVFAKSANFGKGKYNLNNDVQIQYMKLSNFTFMNW